jgi:nucleoside-diphosphate-sugar epimerase
MRALVTGASGFIGRHLCRRLAADGVEVHGLSRRPRPADAAVASWHLGDLADLETARRALDAAGPDWIFHLAGYVSGDRDLALVLPTFHGNLTSTVNLLTTATEVGCRRLVLVGSLEEPDPAIDEPVPASPYAAAKWAASGYARFFHSNYETPVVVARLFMVYGPEQEDVKKLVPYVTLSFLRGEPPRLTSGIREVDWIYVDDAVEGLLAVAKAPRLEGSAVDIGSGRLVTIRDVVERLARCTGARVKALFGALPDRPQERVRAADASSTASRTGWRTRTELEPGLDRTVDWYRQALRNGVLESAFSRS